MQFAISNSSAVENISIEDQTVTVTLDIMCYDDLPLEDLNWTDLLDLQGDESVEVNVRDYGNDVPVW